MHAPDVITYMDWPAVSALATLEQLWPEPINGFVPAQWAYESDAYFHFLNLAHAYMHPVCVHNLGMFSFALYHIQLREV